MYIYIYIYIYVHTYTYTYIHMYIYTHIYILTRSNLLAHSSQYKFSKLSPRLDIPYKQSSKPTFENCIEGEFLKSQPN